MGSSYAKDDVITDIDEKTQLAIEAVNLNSENCDLLFHHYLRVCGYEEHANKSVGHWEKEA